VSEFEFRRLNTDLLNLEQTATFLRTVYPKSNLFNTNYLKWLYSDNPNGSVIGFNAYSKDRKLVGHYGLIPVVVLLFGKVTTIGLSINSATSAEVRGRGLFTTLAELTYAAAKEKGCEAIIGISNKHSTPTFIEKLNFHLVCPLEARICFSTPSPKQNLLRGTTDLEFLYDSDSVNWRLNHPVHKYYVSNSSVNYLVYRAFNFVEILMTYSKAVSTNQSLRHKKLKLPKIWIGKSNVVSWTGVLNLKIPQRLRPSPLNLIFRDLVENRRLEEGNLHFECLNFDAY
jgi:hypothetical protein